MIELRGRPAPNMMAGTLNGIRPEPVRLGKGFVREDPGPKEKRRPLSREAAGLESSIVGRSVDYSLIGARESVCVLLTSRSMSLQEHHLPRLDPADGFETREVNARRH